jgi:hypothetical protein
MKFRAQTCIPHTADCGLPCVKVVVANQAVFAFFPSSFCPLAFENWTEWSFHKSRNPFYATAHQTFGGSLSGLVEFVPKNVQAKNAPEATE